MAAGEGQDALADQGRSFERQPVAGAGHDLGAGGRNQENRVCHLVCTSCGMVSVTDPLLAGQPFTAAPNAMEEFIARQRLAAAGAAPSTAGGQPGG